MRIIFYEIKKVFSIRKIILLLVISLVIYHFFIVFYFQYFPNGRPEKDYFKISCQMLKDYGTSMDEKEFENFKELYNKKVEEADKYLQSSPEFVKVGITTYEKFKSMDMKNEDLSNLWNKAFHQEKTDIFYELQTRGFIISSYERIALGANLLGANKSQIQRYNEIIKNDSIRSIFPFFVYFNYDSVIYGMAILVVFSIMFMISPIYIKDANSKVNYIQYTSKTGRRIFKNKLMAALISSFMIMTIYFTIFFILYSQNKVGIYLNSSLNSFLNGYLYWYDLTFIQYIVLTVVGIYIIGFAVTLIGAFISRVAPNYITLIGIQVPIFFIIINLCSKILLRNFAIIRYPKYLQPSLYLILISVGITLISFRMKKEKVVDIV